MDELAGFVAAARRDPDIAGVLLFGSAARDEPHRDLDVALVLVPSAEPRAHEVRMRYLDATASGVDVQVFQALPLHVRARVLRDHRLLAAVDEDALYAVALRTARDWEDWRPFCEAYLEGAGLA